MRGRPNDAPSHACGRALPYRVGFSAPRQVVHAAVDFDGDAGFADCEIDDIAPDAMLSNHMDVFPPQAAQRCPSAVLGDAHVAVAGAGVFTARHTSQAPKAIIGIESSMPIVT